MHQVVCMWEEERDGTGTISGDLWTPSNSEWSGQPEGDGYALLQREIGPPDPSFNPACGKVVGLEDSSVGTLLGWTVPPGRYARLPSRTVWRTSAGSADAPAYAYGRSSGFVGRRGRSHSGRGSSRSGCIDWRNPGRDAIPTVATLGCRNRHLHIVRPLSILNCMISPTIGSAVWWAGGG